MDDEDNLLPISALQHYVFCPRQCALIHLEQLWTENKLTVQGRQLHDRAHEIGPELRGGVRIVRGLRLRSRELGLVGQADVVELRRAKLYTPADQWATVPGLEGKWTLCPIEYKRGRPKANACDRVQLCAQAMCLEEMLRVRIPEGSLFYSQPRRHEPVVFDAAIREQVREVASRLHEVIKSGVTPPAEYSRKCRSCSLIEQCLPKSTSRCHSAQSYLKRQLQASLHSLAGETR